ncbi:MAG TPA: SPOR domain-containing protein [Novimethylophilus sp.]|jgi:hypothetical protein|uniref:SPOR domain-containing protein n=1 Tax=Novimethylophilus sp. TaxID=2137426 RepID=UPI002F3FE5E0
MKWLVWLLLLVNALLLGYFRLDPMPHVEPVAGHEAIEPGKIKILTPDELSGLPKKDQTPSAVQAPPPVAPQPVVATCYEWGSFAGADVARARSVLDKLSLEAVARQQAPQDAIRYWVYIPPRKTLEEAQIKVSELKALGVTESYIVQEPLWRFAVSLGVFKDDALASRFLDDLHNRGVRSAVKGRRNHEGGQTSYTIRNASLTQADAFDKLKPDFPGSELKQVSCQ